MHKKIHNGYRTASVDEQMTQPKSHWGQKFIAEKDFPSKKLHFLFLFFFFISFALQLYLLYDCAQSLLSSKRSLSLKIPILYPTVLFELVYQFIASEESWASVTAIVFAIFTVFSKIKINCNYIPIRNYFVLFSFTNIS